MIYVACPEQQSTITNATEGESVVSPSPPVDILRYDNNDSSTYLYVCFSIVLPVKVKHTERNFVERQEHLER
jgi:hypothetical protein